MTTYHRLAAQFAALMVSAKAAELEMLMHQPGLSFDERDWRLAEAEKWRAYWEAQLDHHQARLLAQGDSP